MTKSFQPSRAAIARLAALAFIGLTVTAPAYANGIDETAWAAIPPGDATTVDTPAVAESPDGSRLVVTRNADLTMSFSFNGGATKPITSTGITGTTQTAPRAIFFNGQFVLAHHGTDGSNHIWDLQGQDDFESLTLSPSVDASASGHWHGFVRLGDIC